MIFNFYYKINIFLQFKQRIYYSITLKTITNVRNWIIIKMPLQNLTGYSMIRPSKTRRIPINNDFFSILHMLNSSTSFAIQFKEFIKSPCFPISKINLLLSSLCIKSFQDIWMILAIIIASNKYMGFNTFNKGFGVDLNILEYSGVNLALGDNFENWGLLQNLV